MSSETFKGARCTAETRKAILVQIDDEEYWIPKSQVEDDSEVYQSGDEGELVVTSWFAEKEGLS